MNIAQRLKITTNMRLTLLFLLISSSLFGQSKAPKIQLPNIPGYITLKGDFHLHTVYSDGYVWPTTRVNEAAEAGLDVISITEHTDFERYPDEIKRDRNRAYDIAAEQGKKSDVIVIRGAEISPRVPPYHNNALFLKDLNSIPYDYMLQATKKFVMKDKIERKELLAPFLEVQKQGGFVLYNHPNYNWWDQKDRELFTDIHQELLKKGILGGVEVVNSGKYNVIAHRMAEKYNLTMFGNSDAHNEMGKKPEGKHRPMTLIFAKERTPESIEEAIRARRTAVFYEHFLIGRQKEVEALFHASLKVTSKRITDKKSPQLEVKIQNSSDIPYDVTIGAPYDIENTPLGKLTIKAHSTAVLLLNPIWEWPKTISLKVQVDNILVSPEKGLETQIVITP